MIALNKPLGLTPLQALEQLQQQQPELQTSKLAYAGKLDPQAEGVMLVLVDEECKQRDHWQGLDKVYEWELLLGLSTDTHDVMGLITELKFNVIQDWSLDFAKNSIEQELQRFTGKFIQHFPAYSSKVLAGRKYQHVAEGEKLELPSKQVEIYSSELLSLEKVDFRMLLETIHNRIKHVSGQFRQAEILASYAESFGKQTQAIPTFVGKIQTHTGSGVYIRQLAHEIGQRLGCQAIAYSIKRTQVGNYTMADTLRI